jgi:fructose-1,6-bisphosphatase/inositol monophosphatase family enzyme
MCCHPYDCAGLLVAEEAGVVITDARGQPLDAPLDTTTGVSWVGYANAGLRRRIEPHVLEYLERIEDRG